MIVLFGAVALRGPSHPASRGVLETLPGITIERAAGGLSLLRRDGTTYLPFRDA